MADILFARVAEKIQFGLVGPKDSAVPRHPVHPDCRVVHKVTEVRFAPPEGFFDLLAFRNFEVQGIKRLESSVSRRRELPK